MKEYQIDSDKKEIKLSKRGYRGIANEISSMCDVGKGIVEELLDDVYLKVENDRLIDETMFFKDTCKVTVSAKCSDEDDFDEDTGMRICEVKADLKYHNMMYNRYVYIDYMLGKIKLAIAKLEKKHLEKIERLERDLDQYVR